MNIRSVCIFCGASSGFDPGYHSTATKLGEALGNRGINLVYGGGRTGLMGAVADGVLNSGGEVTGVIPDYLSDRELGHQGLTRLEIVKSMHERKRRMFDLANAIVVLPGGIGTLEETLEIITWKQLGMHNKAVIILNFNNYWQKLDELISNAIDNGFAKQPTQELYDLVCSPGEVMSMLEKKN